MRRAELLALSGFVAGFTACEGTTDDRSDAVFSTDVLAQMDVAIPDRVTWSTVQPVYFRNCGGCHGGQGSGGTNFAVNYDDVIAESDSCPPDPLFRPRTVAQCAVERVDSGTMPPDGVHVSGPDTEIMRRFLSSGLDPE